MDRYKIRKIHKIKYKYHKHLKLKANKYNQAYQVNLNNNRKKMNRKFNF